MLPNSARRHPKKLPVTHNPMANTRSHHLSLHLRRVARAANRKTTDEVADADVVAADAVSPIPSLRVVEMSPGKSGLLLRRQTTSPSFFPARASPNTVTS